MGLDGTYNVAKTRIELKKLRASFDSTFCLPAESVDDYFTRLKGLYEDLLSHNSTVQPADLCETFLLNIRAELSTMQTNYNVGRLLLGRNMQDTKTILPLVRAELGAHSATRAHNAEQKSAVTPAAPPQLPMKDPQKRNKRGGGATPSGPGGGQILNKDKPVTKANEAR